MTNELYRIRSCPSLPSCGCVVKSFRFRLFPIPSNLPPPQSSPPPPPPISASSRYLFPSRSPVDPSPATRSPALVPAGRQQSQALRFSFQAAVGSHIVEFVPLQRRPQTPGQPGFAVVITLGSRLTRGNLRAKDDLPAQPGQVFKDGFFKHGFSEGGHGVCSECGFGQGAFEQIADFQFLCPFAQVIQVNSASLCLQYAENIPPLTVGHFATHAVPFQF